LPSEAPKRSRRDPVGRKERRKKRRETERGRGEKREENRDGTVEER
jgi:hypothetical protein